MVFAPPRLVQKVQEICGVGTAALLPLLEDCSDLQCRAPPKAWFDIEPE